MFIEKIIIFDYKNEEANSFQFSKGANIISSKDNTSGKSCLLKSIYYALGLDLQKFAPDWTYKEMIFKIYYDHDGNRGFILRSGDNFWVNGHSNSLSLKEYSAWLLNLLDIRIKLPLNGKEEMQDVYASAPLSLFYIDQDTSWNGALYKNTVNLKWYKPNSIPKNIFEYLLDISNDDIVELEDKKTQLKNEKNILTNQSDVLSNLKDDFSLSASSTIFDESVVKEEVSQYLKLADTLGHKIQKYKANIYSKRIQLDALLLDMEELNEILKYLETSYKNIQHKCTQCNSHLTTEQSIQRMKLDSNKVSIQMHKLDLHKKIKKLQEEINGESGKKLDLEKEYAKLLSIAETKQGELTLGQYIEEKAKENTQNIYCNIKNDLYGRIDGLEVDIKKLEKEIRVLKKTTADKKEAIKKYFETLLLQLNTNFPKVNLDYKFLEFKEIKDSGSIKNEVFLCLYMAYSSTILKYSSIKLPFVLDSFIKDELDESNIQESYKLVEKTLLSSGEQTFFAMLDDKFDYIKGSYNTISLEAKKLLNKGKFIELKSEFSCILDTAINSGSI